MSQKAAFARGSAVVSMITFIGHLLSTGLKLLISRNFGLVGFGQYALIMAFSRFFSTIIQMGYHQSMVYFISKFRTHKDWVNVKYFFVSGIRHILVTSLFLMMGLFLFKDMLFKYIHTDSGGIYTLIAIAFISATIAINNVLSSTLRSLKLFKEQAILFTSSFPALMIIALLLLKVLGTDMTDIHQFIYIGIVFNVILLIAVYVLTRKHVSTKIESNTEKDEIKQLTRYSMPIWLSSALQSASRSSDRIMLGIFSSISQVGIYGAGFTFSILFAFPLKAMGPVFQPNIVDMYTQKDFEGINDLYNTMVRWSALFVIPAFSGLLCFGDSLILIFGTGFEDAYPVMIILSFAQMISTISGLAGTMLNMTEKQGAHARINAYGFVIAIVLNLLLIPKYGALGAAIGTGVTLLITNIFRVNKLLKYFSVKTDYSTIIWLTLKFLPLAAFSYWLNQQNILHWLMLLSVYAIFSIIIVYTSLLIDERNHIKTYLRKILS